MRRLRLRMRPTQTVSGLVLRPPTRGSRFIGPVGVQRRPPAEGNFTSTTTKSKCQCPDCTRPPRNWIAGLHQLAMAGAAAVHTGVRTARCSQSDGGAASPLRPHWHWQVSANNLSADPGGGSTTSTGPSMPHLPSSRHLGGDWDVSPLRLASRRGPGLPTVSPSRRCPSCPLRFVLGLESTTRIPKLGELGHQRCTASFRCTVQPGAFVTRGKRVGRADVLVYVHGSACVSACWE